MTNEIEESLKEQIKQRLLDPLIGIIIISTALYNWKLILILILDSKPIIERLNYIENIYFLNFCSYLNHFGIPLLISIFWFFLYPILRHYTSMYYTSNYLKTEKMKADLANNANNIPRLELLEKANNKLQSIEPYLIKFYKMNKEGNASYNILKCEAAEIGSWVNDNGFIGKLAYQTKEKSIWANGIVFEKMDNGYVLIQTTGTVSWDIVGAFTKKIPTEVSDYYLSTEPGKMEQERSKIRKEYQTLGTTTIEGNEVTFKLDLKVTPL
ncbi:hypothetical protein [Leptospira idonii]|uniref:Uncharacterized protein n=1 Tax=Leptospira idonii TaxID=1193500 RepID=A0A4R9M1P6_9LEPT|nr:hypothetical protein [Leptospira idonii]TGN20643.1 hypothetical protein EHS15_02675 [Leptospira idonii]